jgi:hypothetical protein
MVSDGVLIGIVLGLIFAAVSYYLYSRIGQLERKVGLMENILLDLKVTTEQVLMTSTEMPSGLTSSEQRPQHEHEHEREREDEGDEDSKNVVVDASQRQKPSQNKVKVERSSVSVNYESMTYKELVQHAKQKGVSGTRNLSKAQVIDMLRRHDSGDIPEEDESKAEDLTELLSAEPNTGGTSLDDLEVDNSLVQ